MLMNNNVIQLTEPKSPVRTALKTRPQSYIHEGLDFHAALLNSRRQFSVKPKMRQMLRT